MVPLNPEQRRQLQLWLRSPDNLIARKVIRAKIAAEKQKIVEEAIKAVADDQYTKDSHDAAREVVFYERVLTLLGSMELGHTPDKPDEEFEYSDIGAITDEEPLTT